MNIVYYAAKKSLSFIYQSTNTTRFYCFCAPAIAVLNYYYWLRAGIQGKHIKKNINNALYNFLLSHYYYCILIPTRIIMFNVVIFLLTQMRYPFLFLYKLRVSAQKQLNVLCVKNFIMLSVCDFIVIISQFIFVHWARLA